MTKTLMIGAAALTMTALGATNANAGAVYSAETTTTLTLVSVQNTTGAGDSELQLAVSTGVEGDTTDTAGEATAETMATLAPSAPDGLGTIENSFAIGSTLSNQGAVSGTATDGTSSSVILTDADMFVENLSLTDTFEVTFELTYDMFASASTDGLDGESASAVSFVVVDTDLLDGATGTLDQDGQISEILSGTVLELALEPVAGGADGELSASASLLLTFVIAPGAAVNMFMFADAEGAATGVAMMDMDPDAVPLPGALGFMILGGAGLAGLRKRAA